MTPRRTPRRCSAIGENGLRCKNLVYLFEIDLCFTHAERARKDRQRLPSYGGGVLSKYEARTRTTGNFEVGVYDEAGNRLGTGLGYPEPVTRTEPSDGFIEWDDDEHIDPLDRIEELAEEHRQTRRW